MGLSAERDHIYFCAASVEVDWRYWKSLLSNIFIISVNFHTSMFYVFSFNYQTTGVVTERALHTFYSGQTLQIF